MLSLGRLDGATTTLPDVDLLLYTFVRKEAVLSSQIEGTQSTLDELLIHEVQAIPGALGEDVREVSRYVDALNHGLERIAGGFPLANRLLREMHGILLAEGRGAQKQPGEFRSSQNWIGGARPGNASFVPPPPTHLDACLTNFEQYLHQPTNPVVKAALAHLQFETIHPFLDGNGRLGRLLTTLLLCSAGVITEPVLYLSLYLKRHRSTYYELLQAVRTRGVWEDWVEFFLMGATETGQQAVASARRIHQLLEDDRKKIETLGRAAPNAARLHLAMARRPITNIRRAAEELGVTQPTATDAVMHLIDLGILVEITGRARGRLFRYRDYMAILDEGTEPLRELALTTRT